MEKRKVTVVALGAGNRMNAYAEYALLHPEEMSIVAVVEPNRVRREHLANRCGVPAEYCFAEWEEFLSREKTADAIFICTPDHLHYHPTMLALEKGYDVLLEKPIAQSFQECKDIVLSAREKRRIVGVCHVILIS